MRRLGIFPVPPAPRPEDHVERNPRTWAWKRELDEDDARARRLGFPNVPGLRPGYFMRVAMLAQRTGDRDVPAVLERLAELRRQIAAAEAEAQELKDALTLWTEAGTGWRGVWPLDRDA